MKKSLVAIVLFICGYGYSQQISCSQREAILNEQVNSKMFTEAYKTWEDRGKCPLASDQAYADIEQMLTYMVEKSSGDERLDYVAKLAAFYDENDKLVKNNKNGNGVKKALLLQKYKTGTPEEQFAALDKAYKSDRLSLNQPKAIQLYFTLYADRFKSNKHNITEEQFIALYDDLSSMVRSRLAGGDDSTTRSYQSVLNGMRALMQPVVSCEKLSVYYGKSFDANKDNAEWLETATHSMANHRCTADSLFEKVAMRWYEVKPDGQSSYQAALAAMRRNNRTKAAELFDIAASYEPDGEKKARIYHTIASALASADKPLAYQYIQKSIAAKADFGKSYLLMAQLIAGAKDCAKTDFEKKALNLLAAQTALKAGQQEPSLKVTAERQAELFRKQSPSSSDIKAEKMGGKTVRFECWLNQSVDIPKS